MYIKHLVGSRAGEIEDVLFEGAKAKVLAGQAEDVYNTLGLKKPVAPAVESRKADDVVPETNSKRKRAR